MCCFHFSQHVLFIGKTKKFILSHAVWRHENPRLIQNNWGWLISNLTLNQPSTILDIDIAKPRTLKTFNQQTQAITITNPNTNIYTSPCININITICREFKLLKTNLLYNIACAKLVFVQFPSYRDFPYINNGLIFSLADIFHFLWHIVYIVLV